VQKELVLRSVLSNTQLIVMEVSIQTRVKTKMWKLRYVQQMEEQISAEYIWFTYLNRIHSNILPYLARQNK
jgi:hypothetical protein